LKPVVSSGGWPKNWVVGVYCQHATGCYLGIGVAKIGAWGQNIQKKNGGNLVGFTGVLIWHQWISLFWFGDFTTFIPR